MGDSAHISLQSIADEHISRLLSLRDGVELNHSALISANPLAYVNYQDSLPPRPRTIKPASPQVLMEQALYWLAAHALSDIISLDRILMEEIRLCVELSRATFTSINEAARIEESRRVIEGKPTDLNEYIKALDAALVEGFPRKEEMKSLEKLSLIFTGEAVGKPYPSDKHPLKISLCTPRVSGVAEMDGTVPFSIVTETTSFASARQIPIDKEMIYRIFFTAFAFYRDILESCKSTILQKYPIVLKN